MQPGVDPQPGGDPHPDGDPPPAAAAQPGADPLAAVRRTLETQGLSRADLHPDPVAQFEAWFAHAGQVGVHQPEAVALATVADRQPSVRLVLLRGVDPRGFVFFTNYTSRKGDELGDGARAAMDFPWHQISRQVRVEGAVERVSAAESDDYFASRPRSSQIGAWASPQSNVLAGRDELLTRVREEEARWEGRAVARPPHWGGFRVLPVVIEFWQGRDSRLHDRFRYRREAVADAGDPPRWVIERLAP